MCSISLFPGSGDIVRIAKNASGTDWGKNQLSLGESFCFYAKANSGKVISSVQFTMYGAVQTVYAADLEEIGALTDARTKLVYPPELQTVDAGLLGQSTSVVVLFEEPPASELTIRAGETKTVNVAQCTTAGYGNNVPITDFTLVKFVPAITGTYRFEAINGTNTDTCGRLYGSDPENSSPLIQDDDAGTGNHFCFTYNCEANTIYYIAVKFHSYLAESGTADLRVNLVSGSSTETKDITFNNVGGEVEVTYDGSTIGPFIYDTLTFNIGAEVSVRFIPNDTRTFAYWDNLDTRVKLSDSNPYTFTVTSTSPNVLGLTYG